MKRDYVSLTVNPCNMCMPMGVVSALYGIKKCMTILHGSQGCSTYIRRHMATHYSEPIDISSSSLTEEGTVYGGEKNLIKGLENMIDLYNPEVIGIATTCLAETIGEDILAIAKTFYETHKDTKVKLIPIPSPGYGGNQFQGYFKALRSVVENVEMKLEPNNKINVVVSQMSPADIRELKDILEAFNIDYILLPDISVNLDDGYHESYNRLPQHGTTIEDVSLMAGAKATIEISSFVKDEFSVGKYLEVNYGVENFKINIPRGLRDTDAFMKLLCKLSGNKIPEKYLSERGRYIDGLIDSHKHLGEARIVIYGEPDLVYSISRLALEGGAIPLVVATGNKSAELNERVKKEILDVAKPHGIDKVTILEDTDFKVIEKELLKSGSNMMIGNSDGRRIEENFNIPLIRVGFPIHDRVGGQRILTIGYRGSLFLCDEIANTIVKNKEESFREELYKELYNSEEDIKDMRSNSNNINSISIEEKTKTHPCFSCDSAHKYARMHLPIAPQCNISCNYCLRKYDCPNESRPGVTTEVLNPEEAFNKYKEVKSKMSNLKVVGIAGPGDALANFEEVSKTLRLIKEYDNEVTFCLSTNGLMLPFYAQELVNLGVTHVTITINAIKKEIGAKIYKYVKYLGVNYEGEEAAEILLNNQLSGLKYLTDKGIVCKVNIVMLKGINDDHIEDVVKKVKSLGATISNIMQMIPVAGSAFENMPLVSNKELNELRNKCKEHLNQMYHCKQCRADAIGLLSEDQSLNFRKNKEIDIDKEAPIEEKGIKIAVASKSGILVDKHFGHADEFYIYEYVKGASKLVDKRIVNKYCTGVSECYDEKSKIDNIIDVIKDCKSVLTLRIGESPRKVLESKGIDVITTYDIIEDAVKKAGEKLLVMEGK